MKTCYQIVRTYLLKEGCDKVPAPEATVLRESTDIRSSSLQPGTCTTATALTAFIMQKNRIISNVYYALLLLLLLCCVEGS